MAVRAGCVLVGMTLCSLALPKIAYAGFVNGDFETGNISGWTAFNRWDGTIGGSEYPAVTQFETLVGVSSQAAAFQVGKTSNSFWGNPSGGGLYQSLYVSAGLYRVTADFASYNSSSFLNGEAGRLNVAIDDGNYIASADLGRIDPDSVLRGNIDVNVAIDSAGFHKFAFVLSRDGVISAETPRQYLDNLQISLLVPEPHTVVLALFAVVSMFWLRRWLSRSIAM